MIEFEIEKLLQKLTLASIIPLAILGFKTNDIPMAIVFFVEFVIAAFITAKIYKKIRPFTTIAPKSVIELINKVAIPLYIVIMSIAAFRVH